MPKAGDRIDVLYDPGDHEQVMVAPPTAEEDRQRAMAALGDSNLISIGGNSGGLSGEAQEQHRQALAAAEKAQQMMQQFMGGSSGGGEGSPDPIALAQLQALRDGGAITAEEFEAAKARLLGEGG